MSSATTSTSISASASTTTTTTTSSATSAPTFKHQYSTLYISLLNILKHKYRDLPRAYESAHALARRTYGGRRTVEEARDLYVQMKWALMVEIRGEFRGEGEEGRERRRLLREVRERF